MHSVFSLLLVAAAAISSGSAQECPTGWNLRNGMCYYFSDESNKLSYIAAESFCQQNNGHLVSFLTVDERDWVTRKFQLGSRPQRYWIGLDDVKDEGTFRWRDGNNLDPEVANWKLQEPNNANLENCAEVWVEPLVIDPEDGKWNDNSCELQHPFVCKRQTGSVSQCEIGWTLVNGRCYQVVWDLSTQWFDADGECKKRGGDLVSIGTSTEEQSVENLIRNYNQPFWIGLSDTAVPGTFAWSDRVTTFSYNNWAAGQPPSKLQYLGSTCVESNNNLGYKWNTARCSDERPFVCERGLRAQCPYGWLYGEGKCYEFVVNPSRTATWTDASKICQSVGAGLVKVESEAQQVFIGAALEGYQNALQFEVWIGASDIGHDDNLMWWDKSQITVSFWDSGMPSYETGRDDCTSIYSGKGGHNWEVTGCFLRLPYICELPEGKDLSKFPSVTVEGKCEEGWRHFKDKCYLFSGEELPQSAAKTKCRGYQGDLISILDADEQSFVVGHLQAFSWIGLSVTQGSVSWSDGEAVTFQNWKPGGADGDGNCVVVENVAGNWDDDDCSNMRAYVCKKDASGDTVTIAPPTYVPDLEKCGGNGWISDPRSANCYKVNTLRRSWSDAMTQCRLEGGDLASINTPNEQLFIETLGSVVLSETHLWLGGNDKHGSLVTDQGWRWSDGSPFNFLNWQSGEPNNQGDEDCMQIYVDSGLWNDKSCSEYIGFICEKVGNVDSSIPGDVADDNCRSSEACCFKHIGCEYRGIFQDSVFTASTEKDKWFVASRGRLNTPADVVILSSGNPEIYVGTGHGAWEPSDGDPDPWLQVDLPVHYEIKGIITQGRNGLLRHEEMQWTTTYKVSYTQDISKSSKWMFISDSDAKPMIFKGNFDQNTMVTNFFPRPIVAKHLRCHPIDYRDRRALRIEYIGCKAACLHKIGMNSGYIPDNSITASSSRTGHEPKQARAPVDPTQCLASAGDSGTSYRGWIAKTTSGIRCQPWNSQSPHPHQMTYQNYPEAGLLGDYCRNPDKRAGGPWCYTLDPSVQTEACDIPVCPTYTPAGWQPSGTSSNEYVQVKFDTHYKVSAITLYKGTGAPGYVTEYGLSFSEDGNNWNTYVNADNSQRKFVGLDNTLSSYMDILVEPIATMFVRITPVSWSGTSYLQFEINGCYVDGIITCSELATNFLGGENTFTVECPPGCLRDAFIDPVYGTDIYTSNSAICPSAIHAGKANDNLGGAVFFSIAAGQTSYTGSYRNGITSESYGAYTSSISFSGYSLRCDDGWYTWNDHCYWYSPKRDIRTWQASRAQCLSMGADLVSILSEGENDFVAALLIKMENAGEDAWLGMTDLETPYYYLWADGSPVLFTKWFYREPNSRDENCVQMYIINGFWNDRECDALEPYICKRPKQFLPPVTTIIPPTDPGCDPGWTGYGPSCYRVSDDEFVQPYADIHCQDLGGRLVSIHDEYEQHFVHALVTSQLPAFSGYTSWIGLTSHSDVNGGQYFNWQRSEESVSYTHWDKGEPEALLDCTFPFEYKGVLYYECTTVDNPIAIDGVPWCSIDPVWTGRLVYCGTEIAQGCTYMDDQTGYWNLELCIYVRYYVCEKDRIGYTQPVETTASYDDQCADGWMGNENTVSCYQINDKIDRAERLTWPQALENCRAQNADLVSIHSSQEEQAIVDLIYTNNVLSYTSFWIGLNDIDPDLGYAWSDGTAVSYTHWTAGEPNDHNGLENCVESYLTSGSSDWNDLNCDAVRNWICKINRRKTPSTPPTLPPPQGIETQECGADTTWILYTAPDNIERCYHFETELNHGFANAERACQEFGGNLVSVHTPEEKSFLLSRIVRSGIDHYWIGLRDVAAREFRWSDESPLNYVNWASGEPNDWLESEGCTEMNGHDGYWNDDNCGIQQAYICMKNKDATSNTVPPTPVPQGNCAPGYWRYGNKCWMIGGMASNERLNWYEAKERCENMSSTLAVINNEYEQAYVNSLMYSIGRNAWIGMWGSPWAPFVWLDQTAVMFTNWGSGQPDYPDRSCVRIDYASKTVGKWNDDDCYGRNAFICYQPVSTLNPEPEPTSTPEDCPPGYKLYGTACFKYMTSAASWDSAHAACLEEGEGIDLASISHGYENSMLKSMFWRDITDASMWIGMTFTTTTSVPLIPIDSTGPPPVLTETVFTWSDGWPVEYTSWGIGEPNTDATAADKGCIYYNRDGGWSAVSTCTTAKPFMCKKSLVPIPTPPATPAPLEGDCDPGFVGFGAYCYYIQPGIYTVETRSFWEARSECESRGAELASFHSEVECIAIVDMLDGPSHNLWIGLTHDGFSGWRWIDETAVDFFNWVVGEPNGAERGEVCVELYPWSGQWNDVDCFQGRGYICRAHKQYAYCGAVPLDLREDCGYTGMEESVCLRRGCCWDGLVVNANFSGCFYPANYGFTPDPSGPEPVSGLSGGAIAGIVIGILLLVVIAGVAFYFKRSGKSVSMADFMYGGGSKPSAPNTVSSKAGFDNPVAGMEEGVSTA